MSRRPIFLAVLLALSVGGAFAQTLTLSSSPNPSLFGNPVVMTAVRNQPPPAGFALQVTFFADGVPIPNGVADMNPTTGVATFSFSGLTIGTHQLQAASNEESTVNTSSNIVNQAVLIPTNTTLTVSPNPATTCDLVTLSATVAATLPPSGFTAPPRALTGVVTFMDGNLALGSAQVDGTGRASITVGPLSVGGHFIAASYGGDTLYGPSAAAPTTLIVNPGTTSSISLSFSINPAVFGQTVTATATVTPSNAPGTVQFLDGSVSLGSAQLTNGTATLTLQNLAVGAHSITARYGGASTQAGCIGSSSVTATLTVNRAPSTTVLACSPNPAAPNQPLTMNATVSPTGVTGSVTFRDGNTTISTSQLSAGRASATIPNLSPGNHTLFGDYSGDANYLPSTGSCNATAQSQSTTRLTSSANPSTPGQSVTLTATVTPSSATGNVTFRDAGATIGTASLISGVAIFSTSALALGQHSLTAVYSGDSADVGSTSNTVSQLVANPPPPPTDVFLTVTPNPADFGQSVTMLAAVNPSSATGTVTFLDGSTTLGPAPVANGVATFTTAALAVGAHSIRATYSGDSSNNPADSNIVTLTINRRTVTLALTAGPSPVTAGQAVTLTAKVSLSAGVTGSVTFTDNGTPLGTAAVNAGTASISTSGLAPGTHALAAMYGGDANNNPATSNTVNVKVLATTTLSLSASPTQTTPSQSVTLTATVAPGAATGAVTFNDGGNALGTANLSGGSASISVTLPVGTHNITATYAGDTAFAGSTSNSVTVSVGLIVTITTLGSSPNPSAVGQTVTLTATTTIAGPLNPGSIPTGSVTFSEGATTLGSANLNGGVATFTISSLSVGSHSITATYGGDNAFATSTSSAVTQVVNNNPLRITAPPATLPDATVGQAYSQQITATGGTPPYTFSSSDTSNGFAVSSGGLISGTPQNAGSFNITVQVRDSSTPQQTTSQVFNVTANFPALPPITINVTTQPVTVTDQPVLQFQLGQAYPLALTGVVTLSFTGNASNLPANYDITQNTAVKFANGQITTTVNIPANSTAAIALPGISIGHVAGTITARLTSLVNSATNQPIALPSQTIAGQVIVPRLAPAITAGSVKIQNVSSTGLEVFLDATSTTRELVSANITFTAASGSQLTGTTTFNNIPLTTSANTFFAGAQGVSSGGDFSLVIPFSFTGDTNAIGSVSVTLTNSVGTSPAVSGGR